MADNEPQQSFRFLNVTVTHSPLIWNDLSRGLLWSYHLHYLAWVNTPGVDSATITGLLEYYYRDGEQSLAGRDPYPASLRIINLVKLAATRPEFSGDTHNAGTVRAIVARDLVRLRSHIEYQILGNHLLENGFGLLWGGFFLCSPSAWATGKRIAITQLREQILSDGAHYERSPMYHAIILWRVLDTINLLAGTSSTMARVPELSRILCRHAAAMLTWMREFPWDATRGHMNDSAPHIAPTREELLAYGRRLGITAGKTQFGPSGYRKMEGPGDLTLLIDAGGPAPSYQPGHAHAGTLGFELHYRGEPVIVDTGTSTYERGERRSYERSTRAHNTVSIGRFDSSEVWAAFRVARRACVTIHQDTPTRLTASHDGYRSRFGIVHNRRFDIRDDAVAITDTLTGSGSTRLGGTATFVITSDLTVRQTAATQVTAGPVTLKFSGARTVRMEPVQIAAGFNTLVPTTAIRVRFHNKLITTVQVLDGHDA